MLKCIYIQKVDVFICFVYMSGSGRSYKNVCIHLRVYRNIYKYVPLRLCIVVQLFSFCATQLHTNICIYIISTHVHVSIYVYIYIGIHIYIHIHICM